MFGNRALTYVSTEGETAIRAYELEDQEDVYGMFSIYYFTCGSSRGIQAWIPGCIKAVYVRLILSGTDVSRYKDNMRITNRACSIVAFNHFNYESCNLISENCFGEYDRLYSESSTGYSKSFLKRKTNNKPITVRRNRDTRLKPEMIASIPFDYAFIRVRNGLEDHISKA